MGAISNIIIDEHYIQQVLQDRENDNSLLVTGCSVIDGVSNGEGYLSNMTRVEANVLRDGKKTKEKLIVKTLPKNDVSEKFVSECTVFPNEMNIFSEVLPKVKELLESVGKPSEIGAKFYYCRKTLPYVLIVEDLTAKGFKMADRRKGLDLNHCLLVVQNLARYHASSRAMHATDPRSVERFSVNFFTEDTADDFFGNMISMGLKAAAPVADKLFSEGQQYGLRLRKRAETLRRDVKALLAFKETNFNVLIHGDMWLNNMMFRYDSDNFKVEEVKFVDFQLGCYASAAIDLQYFINSSPTEEVRSKHIDTLLRSYHSELCETMALLGLRDELIAFEDLLAEFSSNIAYGFMTALTILPIFLADENDDFDIALVSRNENVEEGFHKRANNPLFVTVLKRILPMFDKMRAF